MLEKCDSIASNALTCFSKVSGFVSYMERETESNLFNQTNNNFYRNQVLYATKSIKYNQYITSEMKQ